MNKFRKWLLIKLAGKNSVVLNATINVGDSSPAKMIDVMFKGKQYTVPIGGPALEVRGPGALVAGCTFRAGVDR